MKRGYHGPSDALSLESCRIDQFARGHTEGSVVLENRTRTGIAKMSLGLPVPGVFIHEGADFFGTPRFQCESCAGNNGPSFLKRRLFIGKVLLPGMIASGPPVRVDEVHPGKAFVQGDAVAAGIHPDCSAHASGHAKDKLQPRESRAGGTLRHQGNLRPRFRCYEGPVNFDSIETAGMNNNAGNPFIGYKDICPAAKEKKGKALCVRPHHGTLNVLPVFRVYENLCRSADPEGRVGGHVYVELD